MRVTELMRLDSVTAARERAAQRLAKATRVAAEGTKVAVPSDNATAYAAKVRGDDALAVLGKRAEMATNASNELAFAANALAAGADLVSQVRSIATQGANGTLNAADRKVLSASVSALREQLLGVANTKYGDKYLFAGTANGSPPFDAAGTFVGNDATTRVPVATGVTLSSSVSGARAFTAAGGRDVFAELQSLATALANDDVAAVRGSLDALNGAHAQVVQSEATAGADAERLRSSVDVMTTTKMALLRAREEIDGDPVEHLTELELARMTYERSIAVTRELLSVPTLVGGNSG